MGLSCLLILCVGSCNDGFICGLEVGLSLVFGLKIRVGQLDAVRAEGFDREGDADEI